MRVCDELMKRLVDQGWNCCVHRLSGAAFTAYAHRGGKEICAYGATEAEAARKLLDRAVGEACDGE